MMENLITTEQVRKLGRPIGKNVDEEKLLSYIYETERLNVKPVLGDMLFKILVSEDNTVSADLRKTLLDGGEYTDKDGQFHIISGLRMAMSYYVYAKYVMDGDFQLTRAGVMFKDGSYSSHISSKERSDCYNDALDTANGFMYEVKLFLKNKLPTFYRQSGNRYNPQAMVIRRLGN